jgi:antitoxin component HigA of HigAB toxin-antitoxin module
MTEKRFWGKVQRTDSCWFWLGSRQSNGYGRVMVNYARIPAHRQAWVYTNGTIPMGMWILHKCDTPLCVRPEHLFLGTPKDNTQDMLRKGRFVAGRRATGEKHHNHTLTDVQVQEIHDIRETYGSTQQEIARRFGVSQSHVSSILLGKSRTLGTV